jgi:hypothetical protein
MIDPKKFASAWARLEAFHANLRNYIDMDCVHQYHAIVADLESALDDNFDEFKIPNERLKPRVTGGRMGINGGKGQTFYSKENYCDKNYFLSLIEGLKGYLSRHLGSNQKSSRPTARPSSSQIHVENMYGSNIQQGSPGAVANASYQANYQTNDPQLLKLIADMKGLLETLELSPINRQEADADISTMEVQLSRPQPKASIIKESLRSLRAILEGAAGSMLAPHIAHEISKYL